MLFRGHAGGEEAHRPAADAESCWAVCTEQQSRRNIPFSRRLVRSKARPLPRPGRPRQGSTVRRGQGLVCGVSAKKPSP